jgi:hypothetical protein
MTTTPHYRTFYDTTNIADLPRRARNVLGYLNGPEANYEQVKARRRTRLAVPITIGWHEPGAIDAAIIDNEHGDSDPKNTAQWCLERLDNHRVPTVYCSEDNWGLVTIALIHLGLHYGFGHGFVQRFTADYDGNPAIARSDVAHQYLGSPGASPGHYDVTSARAYIAGWDTPTPLTRRHRRNATHLARGLARRTHPVTTPDDKLLSNVAVQIHRVEGL